LTGLDRRLLETLSKIRKPATGRYLARLLNEPPDVVSQRLAQLAPIVRREQHSVKCAGSDQTYKIWAYSLAHPELVAARIFAAKTCPKSTMLNTIE
jgi:hypothetical protein